MKEHSTHDTSHFVKFYYGNAALIDPLAAYVSIGLRGGETCIVITSAKHRDTLEAQLATEFDLKALAQNGQYLTFDAQDMLSSFMRVGHPDEEAFTQNIAAIIAQTVERGKPIRAFSEMVALVRKKGDDEAVLKLERLWDELAEAYDISLFCAYPGYYFDDTSKNTAILSRIKQAHSAVV